MNGASTERSPQAPGSFIDWGQDTIAPTGTLVEAPAPARSRALGRSWQSWTAIAVAVALAALVVLVLAVTLLGTKNTSSSTGLGGGAGQSAAGQSTTTAATKAPSDTRSPTASAPTSTAAPSGSESQPGATKDTTFRDPDGVYTLSIDPGWVASTTGNGRVWTIPGASADQPSGTVDITTQVLGAPTNLNDFTQSQLALLAAFPAFKVSSNSPTTLADGTAATVITYTAELVPGQPLDGTVTFTLKGRHAVAVTLATIGGAPPSITPSALAYIHTLHLN